MKQISSLYSEKTIKTKGIQLTSMEISELVAEGFITMLIMLLLNIALVMILSGLLNNSVELVNIVFTIKRWLATSFASPFFYSWQKFLIIGLILLDIWVVYWRLRRRYKQMQLQHIISELHYISMGNFNHRIPFELNGDLGNVVNSINVLVDSTVQAIEDEREIEKSKDELISNVSHDIRTPLTSIIGYLGLLEANQAKTEEDRKKYIHTAYEKSKQMKTLVEDLFEYTKVRQPSAYLNITRFDLSALLTQMSLDFELDAHRKNVEIITNSVPERIMMRGDTEKIVRVFNNLLSNALKYGTGATQIILEAKETPETILVIVKNNGAKIPEDSIKPLFDRFYRAESSRSRDTGGSGLGLAITQSIVRLHHGDISVTSNDSWTSFVLKFPKNVDFKEAQTG